MAVDQRYVRLVQWAKDNEAFVHPSVTFVKTAGHGVECIVGKECAAIEPRELFMRVNYKLTLSYWNAISAGKPDSCYHSHSIPLPQRLLESSASHETISAIFLVQQYLLGEESFWAPHINIIPQPHDKDDAAIPLLWDDVDLTWLRGTYLEADVPSKRKDLESNWSAAVALMAESGWDVAPYTFKLCLWAHYIFASRSFSTLAIEGDSAAIKDEYQPIFRSGASIDDVPKVLLPVLDLLNHDQRSGMGHDFNDKGLGLRKATKLAPGEPISYPYDKDTQRYNNTHLLKEFGFILPDNEFAELVMPFPFDLTKPQHPSHIVLSTASSPENADFYASSEEIYLSFVTVRAPRRHPLGLVNPSHPARALRHFHPKLVSMVSFKVATLTERAAWRNDPEAIPSPRNQQATIKFLGDHLSKMLETLKVQIDGEAAPANYRQRLAREYIVDQAAIIEDVLRDMAIDTESFFVED